MKYFALLKDSFREALDSKVLYVMIVLSTLVIAFVALFSFETAGAQKTFEQFFPDAKHRHLDHVSWPFTIENWRDQ